MASYLINKNHHDESIIKLDNNIEGYIFKPKSGNESYIKVSEVKIVDKQMIDKILSMKFDKLFRQVAAMAMYVINNSDDEATESDAEMVLGEVELVRQILLNRYQKFLNHEKEELFLKKLRLIENEMRMKQFQIKQKTFYLEEQQERTHGRSR